MTSIIYGLSTSPGLELLALAEKLGADDHSRFYIHFTAINTPSDFLAVIAVLCCDISWAFLLKTANADFFVKIKSTGLTCELMRIEVCALLKHNYCASRFFGDIALAGETAYLHLNQKRAFQNSRFAQLSMGFKRKADPAEVEEIEDEEEALWESISESSPNGCFQKIKAPQNGWFIRKTLLKPLFSETPI